MLAMEFSVPGGAALGCRGQVLEGEGSASVPGMLGPSNWRNSEKSLLIPTGTMEGVLLSWFLPSVVFALDSHVLNIGLFGGSLIAVLEANAVVCSPHIPALSTPDTLPARLNGPEKPELPSLGQSQEPIKSPHHHTQVQCVPKHMGVHG